MTCVLCRYLADIATEVIKSQGPYNLFTANCQTFAKAFLKKLGEESDTNNSYVYVTWPDVILPMSSHTLIPYIAVGIGVTVRLGFWLYCLLRDDENDDKSNEGDKHIQVVPL